MTNQEIKARWDVLLKPVRFRPSRSSGTVEYKTEQYDRIPYDSDYSRIALSAPFRRLQDKAQVFPLEKNDFSRTRLTHSIEVSGISKGIGVSLENILLKKGMLAENKKGHLSSLLSVSGLIHDIGNPPFGHFGEKTIQHFFKNYFASGTYLGKLNPDEKNDFLNFDGNVQGFRLLLKLGLSLDKYSFNLTYPTLASMIKYPKSSTEGNKEDYKTNGGIEYKKFGYFQSEKEQYETINSELELNNHRHPLAYLLEAADDIAYCVSDIEDGCKKGTITLERLLNTLDSTKFNKDNNCKKLFEELKKVEKTIPSDFPSPILIIAQECRIKAQIIMIEDIIKTFMDNQQDIISGRFEQELLKVSDSNKLREFFEEMAECNFNSKLVQKSELVGENIITFLLNSFINASMSADKNDSRTKNGKLYNIISQHYKYIIDKFESYPNQEYKQLMLVTDYISGMTDTYALTLYHELLGIK